MTTDFTDGMDLRKERGAEIGDIRVIRGQRIPLPDFRYAFLEPLPKWVSESEMERSALSLPVG